MSVRSTAMPTATLVYVDTEEDCAAAMKRLHTSSMVSFLICAAFSPDCHGIEPPQHSRNSIPLWTAPLPFVSQADQRPVEEDKENVDPCPGVAKTRQDNSKGRERRVLRDITERFAHVPLRGSSCSAHESNGTQAALVEAVKPKRNNKAGLKACSRRKSHKLLQQRRSAPVSMTPVMLCTGVR